jgi:predicted phosphate transport protein (TIGR00153 family)
MPRDTRCADRRQDDRCSGLPETANPSTVPPRAPTVVPIEARGREPSHSRHEGTVISIFPKQEDFFTLFRSQAQVVRQGCDQLHEMMERFDDLERRSARLKEVEHQGDLITHEIFERLNRTFITPLEREDIHNLASGLDDVLDSAEAIGSRFVLFKIQKTTPAAVRMSRILVDSAAQLEQAVAHLKDFKNLMSFTIEINRLENEADACGRDAVADLFSGRHETLDVLRWKEIYGRLEAAADQCEDVANTIESIVLKNR